MTDNSNGAECVQLDRLCSKGKSSLRQKDVENDGPYLVYGASGVVGRMSVYQNEHPYVAVVKDGAGVGRAMLCAGKTSVLGTMQALLPKEGTNLSYLLHLVRSLKLGEDYSGSTIPHIYFKDYGKRMVPVPTISRQAAIAGTLDSIERLESSCDVRCSKLDELVKSQFVEMFGDQKTNSLGLPKIKLGDAAVIGSSKRVFKEELVSAGVPFLRGTEVGALAMGKQVTPELFITTNHYRELVSHTGKPDRGDLLLPSICPDGQIWLVNTDKPFYFKDGRVLWIRPDRTLLDSAFLLHALRNRFIADFESFASGTTFAELKIFVLKELEITLPSLALQHEFANFVTHVDKLRTETQRQKQDLQTLYDSLAQEYFAM